MMKPMTKKILLGAPAVALSAALACTMVACGGGGEQDESGGDAAVSKSAYESQKIEVEGFTVESLADGWTLTEMDEKHSDAEFSLDAVDDGHVDVYTASKDPMGEAKLAQNNMGGGEIDEVEINGVTWTRFVATHGATYLYAEASNGTTVSIYANSNLTWEDALPMFEMVTLK